MYNLFNIDELNLTKFLLCKNSKIPLKDCSWKKKENWITTNIDFNYYNYGIIFTVWSRFVRYKSFKQG